MNIYSRLAFTLAVVLLTVSSPFFVYCKLNSNPFKIRELFKIEFQIGELVQKLPPLMQAHHVQLKKDIYRYLMMHNFVKLSLESVEIYHYDQLNDTSKEIGDLLDDVLVGNPIHVFALMRRCVHFVDKIVKELNNKNDDVGFGALLNELNKLKNTTLWPNINDVKMATVALARVQHTYQLYMPDLMMGKIGDRQTRIEMFPEDANFLAKTRIKREPDMDSMKTYPEYAKAIEWLEVAHNFSSNLNGDNHETTKAILDLLIKTRKDHDDNFKPPTNGPGPSMFPNELFFLRPIGEDLSVTGHSLRLEEKQEFDKRSPGVPADYADTMEFAPRDFHALCRGDQIAPTDATDMAQKRCYFTTGHPYLNLGPFKAEVLGGTKEYPVMLFHDVLHDKEVAVIKAAGTNQEFEPSRVQAKSNTMEPKYSAARTQVSTWFNEIETPHLIDISRRLDWISGLRVVWDEDVVNKFDGRSEPYQVGVYTPGGVHLSHSDTLENSGKEWYSLHGRFVQEPLYLGNRIATVMLYMSTVDGGGTAFPNAGAVTMAEKGSVAFWFNMRRDGTLEDHYSIHGGCPTMFGIKWVANKWIRAAAQFYTRPCELKPSPKPETQ